MLLMVRMSDILKKAKQRKEEKEKVSPEQEIPTPPQASTVSEETKVPSEEKPALTKQRKEEASQAPEVRISPLVMKETKPASDEETKKLYAETLSLVQEITKENIDYEHIDNKKINTQIERIIEQLRLNNKELLKLALITDPNMYNYPSSHLVNNCILSIEISLALGYDKPKSMELGIVAIFFDIGLCKCLDLVKQPKKISSEEHDEIKNHVAVSAEISKKTNRDLSPLFTESILQHHERLDGSGYPAGLKEESINEYARILSVVDVYEALMHPRSYRPAFPPVETMKEFLNRKRSFDQKIIKILIERIGIFPLGSFVELSTKEKAEVAEVNRGSPLRPVVKIAYDANGNKLTEDKLLDLSAEPNIFIRGDVRSKLVRNP